jgi:hypothetical protein
MPGETSIERSHAVRIPGFRKRSIIFESNRLTYREKTLYYTDVTEIAFQSSCVYYNGVPDSPTYRYIVCTGSDRINFSFGNGFYLWNESAKEAFSIIADLSQQKISPSIIDKLLDRIFHYRETLQIGDLHIDSQGYFVKRILGGTAKVGWSEPVYTPAFGYGEVLVWQSKKDKRVKLTAISMLEGNAVLLPELIPACISVAQKHSRS